jgi:photosystem II stability/assembly factor-like uncharacterized protein
MTPCRRALSILASLAALAAPAGAGDDPFAKLKFRLVGPAAGGRASRAVGVPGQPLVYYVATAGGGVWKSEDGGLTFKPIFDDQPTSSTGSIAVSPADPNLVWVGSGEANIRGNVAPGAGIFKSSDAGKSWTQVWKQVGQIGTMAAHPLDPDIAFAAVLGHAFGPNRERGVYRTRDGGATWQQVLSKDEWTGASDVTFDPQNPSILFAGLWQARRQPWGMTSGGPGSGLYQSRDGGSTWRQLTGHGLPAGIWGKVGVRVASSDSRRVYALIEAEEGGLFRSDDGGESWTRVSSNRGLLQRAWYYTCLTVDPRNPDVVWFPQVGMLKTVDGGKTVVPAAGGGWDHHDVWIDPGDPRRMVSASDAGVAVSANGGESWHRPPLAISQFYHVSTDTQRPYWILGALQDYGTVAGPSDSLHSEGITLGDWHWVGGGEAGHVVADPADPDIVYAGEYLGYMSRYDRKSKQARNVSAWPENGSGHGVGDLKYRFQWTAPIVVSRHEKGVVYHAANVLFRSRDGGLTWDVVSPDLTRDDKTKQQWSGGPITGDNTGVEFYGTIFALAESPLQPGELWAGSDDGLVHLTRDGGATWKEVTPSGFPEWATVATIEASRWEQGTAYVVIDAHRLDDPRPYLFKTTDYGATWSSLAGKLPPEEWLHAVREDGTLRGFLWLGGERGVWFSRDSGATWTRLKAGLPTAAVHDLVSHGDDLVVGTMGRSAWVLDGVQAIREFTPAVEKRALHVFTPQAATRFRVARSNASKDCCGNPPRGVVIDYWLREAAKGEARLEILDTQGRLVRTLTSNVEPVLIPPGDPDAEPGQKAPEPALSTDAGLHRAVWDLNWQAPRWIPDARVDWGDVTRGPLAVPGKYSARLTAGGQTATVPFTVDADPRATATPAELETQLEFALELRDTLSELGDTVARVRSLRAQLRERAQRVSAGEHAEHLRNAARLVEERLGAIEAKLHNPEAQITYDILARGARLYSQLVPLYDFVNEGDGLPTQGVKDVLTRKRADLAASQVELETLVRGDLASVNRLAASQGIGFVIDPGPAGAQ